MKWIYYTLSLICLWHSPAKAQIYDSGESEPLLPPQNNLFLYKSLPLDSQNRLLNSPNLLFSSQNKAPLGIQENYQENTLKAPCSEEKIHWKTLANYLEEGRALQHELLTHVLQKIKALATEVFSLKEEIHLLTAQANKLLQNTKQKCTLNQLENSHTSSLHDPCISADTSKLMDPYSQSRKEDAHLLELDKGSPSESRSVFSPHLNFFNSSELFSL